MVKKSSILLLGMLLTGSQYSIALSPTAKAVLVLSGLSLLARNNANDDDSKKRESKERLLMATMPLFSYAIANVVSGYLEFKHGYSSNDTMRIIYLTMLTSSLTTGVLNAYYYSNEEQSGFRAFVKGAVLCPVKYGSKIIGNSVLNLVAGLANDQKYMNWSDSMDQRISNWMAGKNSQN